MSSVSTAIAEYEEEHAFARQLFLPEEERAKYTTVGRQHLSDRMS